MVGESVFVSIVIISSYFYIYTLYLLSHIFIYCISLILDHDIHSLKTQKPYLKTRVLFINLVNKLAKQMLNSAYDVCRTPAKPTTIK